jgi:putative membrane protein
MGKKKNKKNKNKVSQNFEKKSFWGLLKKYFPHILLGIYLVEMLYLAVGPFSREVWWAENLPVMIAVGILIFTYKKFRFSNFAYFLMAFFLMFHTVGGHYTFELVPFDWGNSFLDKLNLDFLFGEGRNNFDRVGHYLIGVFAYPLAEFVYRTKKVSSKFLAVLFGVLALGFWGSFYEIVEMIYAIKEGGSAGAAFLGSQGDIWDAQKDMLLDILGALTVSIIFWWNYRKK